MLAVSRKLRPESTKASRILKPEASSTVHPKTFPPNINGQTSSPELPNWRVFTLLLSLFFVGLCPAGRDPGALSGVSESDGSFDAVVGGGAGVMNRQDALIFNDAHLELDGGVLDGAGDFRFAEFPGVDARKVSAGLLQVKSLRARRAVAFDLDFPLSGKIGV